MERKELSLIERYNQQIAGVLSCYDRVIIQGTLPGWCFDQGMTSFLNAHHIRIFDYPEFAQQLKEQIRDNAEHIAEENQLEIEFIRKSKDFRKESRIKGILSERGEHPGLVHIFSAMEPCTSYKPWHDKETGRTFLKYDSGKCLHYYFYFIDEKFGLCYLRVPTWSPFRLQFYFNGHNWLAKKLSHEGIAYVLKENAFFNIDDFGRAQHISDHFRVEDLHQVLDIFAERYCPVFRQYNLAYRWSIMQVEYSTDIVFKRQSDLKPLYESLVRTTTPSNRRISPPSLAKISIGSMKAKWETTSTHVFSVRELNTRWVQTQSKCMISLGSSYELRPPPTMYHNLRSIVKSKKETEKKQKKLLP